MYNKKHLDVDVRSYPTEEGAKETGRRVVCEEDEGIFSVFEAAWELMHDLRSYGQIVSIRISQGWCKEAWKEAHNKHTIVRKPYIYYM